MPNRDGTGPIGRGPRRPRGFGGSKECVCPKCGYKESHMRGTPCSQKDCPKCSTPMRGYYCQ